MAQVHPIQNAEPQNPEEIVNITSDETANGSQIQSHSNQAFVVEMFLRENPEVHTTQPERDLESTTTVPDEDICRICHDTKDKEELVRVCRCNGSAKYAHKSCVLRWFKLSYRFECELCRYKMKIKKKGFKPMREWSNPCQFLSVVDFIALFFVHALQAIVLVLIVMIAISNKCFSLVCISLILFCFAIVFLLFYCCDGCEYVRYCRVQWIVDNSHWGIASYDEESTHQ